VCAIIPFGPGNYQSRSQPGRRLFGSRKFEEPEIVRSLFAIHAAASAEPQALAHPVPSKA
jgi:hypothetical protein